jgi:hypothetical protein
MTFPKAKRASLTALVAIMVFSTQLSAAQRRRVVAIPPQANLADYSGNVVDAGSGAPVFQAQVVGGGHTVTADAQGHFTIKLPTNVDNSITVQRWGYESLTQTVRISGATAAAVPFRLTSRPVITVKDSDGVSHQLDFDNSSFAYLIPFSGYARYDNASFCKPDGSSWQPTKDLFTKIIGPAMSSTFSACCTRGPVMSAQVEMKSGEKTTVYFTDSCFGNEVDFLGRDRATGQFLYFNFAKIAEIDFP